MQCRFITRSSSPCDLIRPWQPQPILLYIEVPELNHVQTIEIHRFALNISSTLLRTISIVSAPRKYSNLLNPSSLPHFVHTTVTMKLSCISMSTSLFLFTSRVSSHSTESKFRICHDYSIPVNVSITALEASYDRFTSNYNVVDFSNGLAGRTGATALHLFSGPTQVTGAYTIGATICSPGNHTEKEKTILLASHGLGYDRR